MKLVILVIATFAFSPAGNAQTNSVFNQCVDFVVESPTIASQEEAADACHFVLSMDCVNTVYDDPSTPTREDAAAACQEEEPSS